MSSFELSTHFFLALAVILTSCRVVGAAARWLGQPQVVGEMIAGVLLGPSLLGLVGGGEIQRWIFPTELKPAMYVMAQVGLALYMFLVGVEFRTDFLRERAKAAAAISLAGVLVPMGLGVLLATALSGDPTYFRAGVNTMQACLFMGAAMAITAFPMLARIIQESGFAGTRLGTLTLAAGSIDDGLAWCVLAVVLASLKADAGIAFKAIGGAVLYLALVLGAGRPLFRMLASRSKHAKTEEPVSPTRLSIVLLLLALGAWFTDLIGIHAVFGAFVLGAAMPRGVFAAGLLRMMTPLTLGMLVPMYFVNSGLNTRINMLDSWALWGTALLVLGAACAGKFAACTAMARISGEPWRESVAIGALMNCRGLMELIILNIGLERGLITERLFSIGVIMAVVTTLMAAPIARWASASRGGAAGGLGRVTDETTDSPKSSRAKRDAIKAVARGSSSFQRSQA